MNRWLLPILTGVLTGLATVGLSATAGVLISRAALRPEVFLSLGLLATAVRGFGITRAAGRYTERVTGHTAALGRAVDLRLRLFDHIARLGDGTRTLGDVLARAHTDIDAAVMATLRVTIPAITVGLVTGGFAAWAAWVQSWLVLAVAVPSLLFAGVVVATGRAAARLAEQEMDLTAAHATTLLDALAASADGARALLSPRLSHLTDELDRVVRRQARLGRLVAVAREVLLALALVLVCLLGGGVPGPMLVGVALGVIGLFEVLGILAGVPAALQQRRASERRAAELDALEPSVTWPAKGTPLPEKLDVELRDVDVVRGGRVVLQGVDLSIPAGQCVVISGRSGVGKTTLLRVLARQLELSSGSLTFGGVDSREISAEDVHRRIAVAFQDAPVLDGTVEENLRLGAHHADAEALTGMLRDLGLPFDLDHRVGEAGALISGGERARISLARALLSPADLLLLDEPTAHLDHTGEAQVLSAIQKHSLGRTVVLVSHRSAPRGIADRVIALPRQPASA